MLRKLVLSCAALAALLPLGISPGRSSVVQAAAVQNAAYGNLWIVWYRRSVNERWHGMGPYNYYDACNVQADLQSKGFATSVEPVR